MSFFYYLSQYNRYFNIITLHLNFNIITLHLIVFSYAQTTLHNLLLIRTLIGGHNRVPCPGMLKE